MNAGGARCGALTPELVMRASTALVRLAAGHRLLLFASTSQHVIHFTLNFLLWLQRHHRLPQVALVCMDKTVTSLMRRLSFPCTTVDADASACPTTTPPPRGFISASDDRVGVPLPPGSKAYAATPAQCPPCPEAKRNAPTCDQHLSHRSTRHLSCFLHAGHGCARSFSCSPSCCEPA